MGIAIHSTHLLITQPSYYQRRPVALRPRLSIGFALERISILLKFQLTLVWIIACLSKKNTSFRQNNPRTFGQICAFLSKRVEFRYNLVYNKSPIRLDRAFVTFILWN